MLKNVISEQFGGVIFLTSLRKKRKKDGGKDTTMEDWNLGNL